MASKRLTLSAEKLADSTKGTTRSNLCSILCLTVDNPIFSQSSSHQTTTIFLFLLVLISFSIGQNQAFPPPSVSWFLLQMDARRNYIRSRLRDRQKKNHCTFNIKCEVTKLFKGLIQKPSAEFMQDCLPVVYSSLNCLQDHC